MRIGVLTGGGDCPGLNAVIRAIVRKGINAHGHEFVGFRYGWAGVLNNEAMDLTLSSTRGILHRGGTILGSSRTNPYKVEGGVEDGARGDEGPRPRRADPDRRRGHARRRRQAARGRHPGRRRPEDDRQRPRGDRLHVRLPDRRADRHRRDRPPAHHGRVAQPRDGRRGDGPPRRLDRRLLRHGRRRRRDPDPGAPVRHRRGLRPHPAPPRQRRDVLDRRRGRGRDAQGRRPDHRAPADRRLRPRPPRRHRHPARARDRGAHRATSRA